MFGLEKLFGGQSDKTPPLPDDRSAIHAVSAVFICREAIFDRKNRPSGHIFFLQHESPLATAPTSLQKKLDEILLATLLSRQDAWNIQRAFVPISSTSVWDVTVDHLPTTN